jgi:hypothetical protein
MLDGFEVVLLVLRASADSVDFSLEGSRTLGSSAKRDLSLTCLRSSWKGRSDPRDFSDIVVPTDEDGWSAEKLQSPSESELFLEGTLEEESVVGGDSFRRESEVGTLIGTMAGDKGKSKYELELEFEFELELECALGFRIPPPVTPVSSETASAHLLVEGPGLLCTHGLFDGM